jgi:predicted AAA+ superfamily ATPase
MIHQFTATNRLAQLMPHFPAVLIIGARQVGKSSLVERLCWIKEDCFALPWWGI